MRRLCEEFKHFKGQPVEIVSHGQPYIGMVMDNDDSAVCILDECGRCVWIEFVHIDAVIEPQMRLLRGIIHVPKIQCRMVECQCKDKCGCEDRDDDPKEERDICEETRW